MSFSYVAPLALVVVCNVLYNICTKSAPQEMHPMASLTVTYGIGALTSLALYFLMEKDANLIREYSHLNIAPFLLGLSVVGLEVGYIYAYRAGWQVSTAATVQSAVLAVMLMIVGAVFYREGINPSKLLGVVICLVGLYFLNR